MRTAYRALGKHFPRSFRIQYACLFGAAISLLFFSARSAQAQDFADSQKWEIGGHYALLRLPSQCAGTTGCEAGNNGLGANLTYNFSGWLGLDTEMNFFGDNGDTSTATTGGRVTEGLFGFRMGPTTRRWALYSVVRPGFVNFSRVLDSTPVGAAAILPTGALNPLTAAALGSAGDSAGANLPPSFAASGLPVAASANAAPMFSERLRYQAAASSNPMAALGFTSATYFAFNYGEAIEWRPTKHAALRFDIGDTIVSYPGSTLGTPFHQHNFQISQALVIRF